MANAVQYLVTGATGSLGAAVVAKLRADGRRVRLFQRRSPTQPQPDLDRTASPSGDAAAERSPGVEYAIGDLADPAAVDRAVAGAQIVIHCGAVMKGGWAEHKAGTVDGTRNVIAACQAHGVKQLVHISSMSVVDWAGMSGKGDVDESVATEPRADERGAYTRAKLEAEGLVVAAAKQGLPVVILRPGQIFGGGIPLVTGAVARHVGGRWLILGDGKLELPLVYIDDVVDAIQAAVDKNLTGGEVIQIVDSQRLDQSEVLDLAGGGKPRLKLPSAIVFAIGRLSELPFRLLGKRNPIGVYRLESALARLRFQSDRAHELLGWVPRVGVREGIRRVTGATNVSKMGEWSASQSSQPSSPRPASVAHAQATVTVELTPEGEAFANQIGITPEEMEDQVRDQVDEAYQASNLKGFLQSFTDATSFSARGIGVDYGSTPEGFMAGIAANVAAAGSDDVFEDGRPTAGLAANLAVMVGFNGKALDLPKWSVYLNGFYRSGSTDDLEGDITSAGAHIQYRIIDAADTKGSSKAVQWLGLNLTSGIEFTRWNLNTKSGGIPTDLDIAGSGGNASLVLNSLGNFDLTSTATTIPIEATTGFRIAVLMSVYFGVGTDISVGKSTLDANLTGQFVAEGQDEALGTVNVTADGEGDASPAAIRGLVGVQANITALKIFAQANLSAIPAASIAFGVRFVL